jgi:hypothetical protein
VRTSILAGSVLSIPLLTFQVVASDHSVLNGTWTLVPTNSDFNGQAVIQTGTVTIADRDGAIVVTRDFKYEGAGGSFFYKDTLGNEDNSTIHSTADLKTKTKWEHNVLKVTTTRTGQVTVETYHLAPDGTLTATVEVPGHPPATLHFERK